MLIRKAYRFRLKPNREAEEKFVFFASHCRFVWNKALNWNLDRLERKLPIIWYYEMCFWLTRWKKSEEMDFLNDCVAQSLQQKLKNLERAFKNAFDKNWVRMRIPKFQKKNQHNSSGFEINNNRFYLPKIG